MSLRGLASDGAAATTRSRVSPSESARDAGLDQISASAAAPPRLVSAEDPRRGHRGAYPSRHYPLTPPLDRARVVPPNHPRGTRGGAPTRLRGRSASRPRRRRDSSPRKIHVAAARLVSAEYPRRGRGAAATLPQNVRAANARRERGPQKIEGYATWAVTKLHDAFKMQFEAGLPSGWLPHSTLQTNTTNRSRAENGQSGCTVKIEMQG